MATDGVGLQVQMGMKPGIGIVHSEKVTLVQRCSSSPGIASGGDVIQLTNVVEP
jgi:hypothetical protein